MKNSVSEILLECWICGSRNLRLEKKTDISSELTSNSFAITDSNYGKSASIYRCLDCGFYQCPDLSEVLSFYENLEDEAYEETRNERGLQEKCLLHFMKKFKPNGRLLDIGAGSGILVEQALKMGYRAVGVEPSRWLYDAARDRSLPLHLGTFPHPDISKQFDIITLIDVLEHVSDPVLLLSNIKKALKKDGIGVLVIPDVGSIAVRLMRWKWWHFRIAHIGYFNKHTLILSLERAGLQSIKISRPTWYFPANYLFDRVKKYLPGFLQLPTPSILRRILIPLNLRDSFIVIFSRKDEN